MKSTLTFILLFIAGQLFGQAIQKELADIVSAKQNRIRLQSVLSPDLYAMLAAQSLENKERLKEVVSEKEIIMYATAHPQKLQQNSRSKQKINIRIIADDITTLEADLAALGFEESARAEGYNRIVGHLDIDQLLALEKLKDKGIKYVEEVRRPKVRVGSVTSQADTIMGTAKIREINSDLDGTGIKIGVLSDTYNANGGEADGITSGDLPDNVIVVIDSTEGIDEGRAMIELIHDMAPGAELFFATAFGGEENFAKNIDTLAKLGCKIIVDDIIYFSEPFFQDGIVAQKIDEVTEEYDVSYFSSAGNEADNSYESTDINFSDGGSVFVQGVGTINYDAFYDFDLGPTEEIINSFTLDSGEIIQLSLQWDDPFYAIGGVDTDLDIYVFDADDTTLVALSFFDNVDNGEPFEIINFISDKPNHEYFIVIGLFSGPEPGRIKFNVFSGNHNFAFETNSPTIIGHPAAESCVAVGAVDPFFLQPEPFTSLGPSTILFDANGTRKISIEIRNKPDLAGVDGSNNTFFGFDADGDGFPNFFGTSAAAPNVAAVASLVCQANPTIAPDRLVEILSTGAFDFGAPGFDFSLGNGLVTSLSSCIIDNLTVGQELLNGGFTPSRLRGVQTLELTGNVPNFPFEFVAGEELIIVPEFEVFNEIEIIIEKCIE